MTDPSIVHDEMIRYRIIVGLRDTDSNLLERLKTYPELNLDKVIMMGQQREAVREQQAVVRGETDYTSQKSRK